MIEVTPLAPVAWEKAGITSLEKLLDSGLLDSIPLRVVVLSPDRRYLFVNREALALFGMQPDQAIGRRIADVWGAEVEAQFCDSCFGRALAGESVRRRGWRVYSKPLGPIMRTRSYMEEVFIPLRFGDGPVESIALFIRDLTQLKRREAELARKLNELHDSEALKSAIFDHALAALVSTNEEGQIVEFNPAAEAMFGYAREDVRGRIMIEVLISERYHAEHMAELARMRAGGEPPVHGRHLNMEAMRADGTEFPIKMALWRTQVGGAAFFTASMVDMTEQHNAERQRDALRQSEKLSTMGGLLAGVAHELNNPLAVAIGRASLLEQTIADAEVRADVKRIREAAERCGRIVRTFLDIARAKPLRRGVMDLNDVVRAAVEMLNYTFRTHSIELKMNLKSEVPIVTADSDQVAQVVVNLLVNARQALDDSVPGHRQIEVSTGLDPAAQQCVPRIWVRVGDSGPGVPEQMRAKVFEPFFTTKPKGLGTGLGLSVSRSIARAHGGDLILEPAGVSNGATFRLTLPVEPESPQGPVQVEMGTVAQSVMARVLVVDDEREVVSMIRDMLDSAGFDVTTADSGAAALGMLDCARFDVVVSDFRMPNMDGETFWREIASRDPVLAQRTLFVTGDTLSASVREFLDASNCASLEKPFSRNALLQMVVSMLDKSPTI